MIKVKKVNFTETKNVEITLNKKIIKVNRKVAKLFGYYMGCGKFALNGKIRTLVFHLYDNEEFINFIISTAKKYLKLAKPLKYKESKIRQLPGKRRHKMLYFSTTCEDWFIENFSYNFYLRTIPEFIMKSNRKIIDSFMNGWFESNIINLAFHDGSQKAYTTSEEGAKQAYLLGLILNKPFKIKKEDSLFVIYKPNKNYYTEDEDYYYFKLRNVEEKNLLDLMKNNLHGIEITKKKEHNID